MVLTFYCMINFTSFLEVQIKRDPLNDNVLMAGQLQGSLDCGGW